MEDSTLRPESREASGQTRKMESLGQMACGIAHDFNNLLTVITGFSGLMLQSIEPDSPFREPLEQIHFAGQTATELTRQLLAFSRNETVSPRPLMLNEIILDAETMLRHLLGDNIELIMQLDPAAGMVLADTGQMQQVVMNLVINARDAMPLGGRLWIGTSHFDGPATNSARDGDSHSGPCVLLTVEDTGIGINPETQKHIFDPFFTTKESGKGMGMGLSIVYGIVKQIAGRVLVESEPWKGTRFSVWIPRVQGPPIESANSAPSHAAESAIQKDLPLRHEPVLAALQTASLRIETRDTHHMEIYLD